MEKITVELNDSLVFNYVEDDVEITDVVIPQEKPKLDTSFDENQNPKAKVARAVEFSRKEPNLTEKSPKKVPKNGSQQNGVEEFVTVEVNSFLEPVQDKTDDCGILGTKKAKSPVELNPLDINQIKKSTPLETGEVDKPVKTNREYPKANTNLKIGSVTIKPVCSDLASIQVSEALKPKRGRPKILKEMTKSYVTKDLSNIKTVKQQDEVISNELNLNESKKGSAKDSTMSKFDQLKAIIESNCSTRNIEDLATTKVNVITKIASNPQTNEPKNANISKSTEFVPCGNMDTDGTDKNPAENTELQSNKLNNITVSEPEKQKTVDISEPPKRKRGRPVGFSPKKKVVPPLKISFAKYKREKPISKNAKKSKLSNLAKCKNLKTVKTNKNLEGNTELQQFNKLNNITDPQPKEHEVIQNSEPPKRKRGRPVGFSPKKKGTAAKPRVKPLKIKFGLSSKNFTVNSKNPKNIKPKQIKNRDLKAKSAKKSYMKKTKSLFSINVENGKSQPLKRKVGRPKKVQFTQLPETNRTDMVTQEILTPAKKAESEVSKVNKSPLEVRSENSQGSSGDLQPAKKKRGRPKGFSPKKTEVTVSSATLGSSPIKKGKTNGFSPKKTQSTLITQFFKASSENKSIEIDTLETKLNNVRLEEKKSDESTSNNVLETSTHLGSKLDNIEIQQTDDCKVFNVEKAVSKSSKTKVVTFSPTVPNLEAPKTSVIKTGVLKLRKSNLTLKSDNLDAKACEVAIGAKEVVSVDPIPALKTSKSEVSDVEVKILDEPEKNKGLELTKPKRGRPKGSLTKKFGTPDVLDVSKSEKSKESEKTKKDLLLQINNSKTKELGKPREQPKNVEPSTSASSKPSRQTQNASVEIIDVEMPEKKKEISCAQGAKQLYVFVKSKDLDIAEKAAIEAELKRREKESMEVINLDIDEEIIDLEAPKRKRSRVKGQTPKKAKLNDLQNLKPKLIVGRNSEGKNQDVIENSMATNSPKPKRGRPKGFSPKKLGKNIPVDDLRHKLTVEREVKVKEQPDVVELEVSKNLNLKKGGSDNTQCSTVPTSKRGKPKVINPINLNFTASSSDQKTFIPKNLIEDNKIEVKDQENILEVIDLEAPKRKRGRPAKGTVLKRAVSLPAHIETKILTIDLVRADLDPNLDIKNINGFESIKNINIIKKTESDLFKVPNIPSPKQRNSIGKGTSISSTSKKRSSLQFTTPKNIKIVSPFIPRRPEETNTNVGVQKNTNSSPKATNMVSPRIVDAGSPTKKPLFCTVGTQTIDISDDDNDEPVEAKDSEGKMSVSCQADIGAQKGKETETKDSEAKVLVSSVKIFKLDGLIEKRSDERAVGPNNLESVSSRDVTKVSVSEEKEENSEEPIKIEDEIEGAAAHPRGDDPELGVKYETVEQIHTEFKYESQSEAEQMLRRRRLGKFGGPMRGRRRGYNSFKGQTSIDNFVRIVDLDGKLQNMKCRNQIFKCDHCLYVGNCKANLARHSLVHRPEDEIIWFQCTDCPYRSKYEHQLKSHFLVHMDPNKIEFFQCPHCEVRCSRKHNLTNHIRSIHADRKYSFQCAECEYTTFSKDRLVAHLKKHSKEVHACNLCKFVTKRREYLLSHFKMKHTHDIARPFPCDTCSYKGKTKRELDRHYDRMHNKDQLHVYQCNHCSFNSIYKKNLEFHLLHMHQNSEGFQKFVCGHCDKTFSYKNGLKVHIVRCHLKLTDDDWHKCLECKYKSKDVATLKRHIKRNHGAPRLHCQQCSFATNRQMSMDAHVKTHEFDNEDILKCPECPYRIIQMTSFLYHMKVIHGKPISSREAEQYYMQED